MIVRRNQRRRKKLTPGPFIPCKRQNADWKLRWQQLFTGRDPAVNRGKVVL